MASLSTDGNGNRTVQFVGADGKRRSVRLGKVNKKLAESVKLKVEHLAAASASRMPLDLDTAAWVAGVGDDLRRKLAAVGLVARREDAALGAFLADYAVRQRADGKKGSTVRLTDRVATDLLAVLGPDVDVRAVTPRMADDVAANYVTRKLANATAARRLNSCRTFFKEAIRRGLVDANPFAQVIIPSSTPNPARRQYVTRADALRAIAASPPEWQTVVALSRFAGLRAPTEVFSLRLVDVDLVGGRLAAHPAMCVQSPKTEHHVGGESRIVPVFPDLRPFLEQAVARAEAAGDEYVVNGVGERARARAAVHPYGWSSVSLGSMFATIFRQAGLKPWRKPTHNMRASCETDLLADHNIHVVCAWIGNTPAVALKHYVQTLDGDFAKALAKRPTVPHGGADSGAPLVQNPVRHPPAPGGRDRQTDDGSATIPDDSAATFRPVPAGAGRLSGHLQRHDDAEQFVDRSAEFAC